MTVKRPRTRVSYLLLFSALVFPARALPACEDYVLSEEELSTILDNTLGGLRPFVTSRSVKVEPQDAICYLKMQVSVEALAGALKCTLSACSTGVANGRELGIASFTINGCDQIFDVANLDRRTKTAYADVTDKILSHCGTDGYRITSVVPQRSSSGGSVRLILAPTP